ncbi:hypothetical protein [Herbaspirillum sp. YR522]|uniref:hypothetical protein n=1 Tax=Herbaspirillum sp. YR522 TaxID=1144342 RepID=UPI0012FCA3FC|nr:hypothetical protein [Herbaspirillum sp. YR522]
MKDYFFEENILGGMFATKALGLLGRLLGNETDLFFAGTVNSSGKGANSAERTLGGKSIDDLAQAATAADKGDLSVAGRALQKHGNRDGSAFPNAKGNPADVNEQAQQVVNEILNDPATIATQRNTGRFGQVTDIVAPDGRGLRYDANGKLIGFLEPPKK